MRLGRALTISFTLLVGTAVFPGACASDGLVGGDCARGLANCANHCVNLKNDPKNCGKCGNRCEKGVACINGLCGGGEGGWGGDDPLGRAGTHQRDGGLGGAGADTSARGGAYGEFDAGYPNDGSAAGGSGATTGDGGPICVPPYDDAANCGSCHRQCTYPNRVCAPVEGKYDCVPLCDPPLTECNGTCVDLKSDSNNCGQCGRACPSAICQGGECIGAQAGHIVPMCMNLRETTPNSQPTNLLGNAIFLPRFNPVKILAYDEFANPNVRARVDATISWASGVRGAGYRITSISQPDAVNEQLKKPDYDVFLVYDQAQAPTGTLSSYGSKWAKAIESFSYVGGVIVVLDGGVGTKEMGAFLTSSRLLEVTGETAINHDQVYNRQQADAIGATVVSPFLAPYDSCVFNTPTAPSISTIFVVTEDPTVPSPRPMVVHRTTTPPVN